MRDGFTRLLWSLLRTLVLLASAAAVLILVAWAAHITLGTPSPPALWRLLWGLIRQWVPVALGALAAGWLLLGVLDSFARAESYRAENPWYRPEDPDAPWLS